MTEFPDLIVQLGASALVVAVLVYISRKQRQIKSTKTTASVDPYGPALAEAVADRLERGDVLSYAHRDYCGMGLRFADGNYIYGEVVDGELPSDAELSTWTMKPSNIERMVFSSRVSFIEWLSKQSDEALSGRTLQPEWLIQNQRITGRRLRSFARGNAVPSVE